MSIKAHPHCTVIVLTYMNFSNIANNLASIAAQTYQDYEVIIHDDGSSNFDFDYINRCIENAGLKDVTSIYHNDTNLGTVRNYNLAIKRSNGKIIIPLSQDDVFYNVDIIKNICNYLSDSEHEICYGRRIDESGNMLPVDTSFEVLFNDNSEFVKFRLLYRNFIYGASLYFRKELWEKMGGFEEQGYTLLEDYPFCLRLLDNNFRIDPLNLVCIKYGSKGMSSNNSPKKSISRILTNDNIYLYNTIVKNKIDHFRSLIVRGAFHYRWLSAYYCNQDPVMIKRRRFLIMLKYPIIAILHKFLYMIYGEKSDDIFCAFLYKIEGWRSGDASNKVRFSTTRR